MKKGLAAAAVIVIGFSVCVLAQDLGGLTKGLGGGSDVKTTLAMKALEKMMSDLSPGQKTKVEKAKKELKTEQSKEGADKDKALDGFIGKLKTILTVAQFSKFKGLMGGKGGMDVKGLMGGKL